MTRGAHGGVPDAGRHYEEVLDAAPRLECGDEALTKVFRHRWESFARNVVRTPQGWAITEFRQPGPGRAYGTVNAAAGHHILEGRWLRRSDVVGDYVRFWFGSAEAESHRYTEWIAWAALGYARLHGVESMLVDSLPGMVATFEAWEADSLHPSGLYWVHDLTDAMEFSVSGDGLRPTINSYQFANARAIAEVASLAGDQALAERFEKIGARLRRLVIDRLYDPDLATFATVPMSPTDDGGYLATAGVDRRLPDEYRVAPVPARGDTPRERRVRELIGFVPWYVDLPGGDLDPSDAVAELADPDGFAGRFGLRTAELRHPRYGFDVQDAELPRFLCRWNGPTWPYATSQTLTALARIARCTGDPEHGDLFLTLLRQYTASHLQPDGSYLLDEFLDPDTGTWLARDWRRQHDPAKVDIGLDYNHSTFADLILSGLLGLDVHDGDVVVDPLSAAAGLGWFRVSGLEIRGRAVSVAWSDDEGLVLRVAGSEARRPELGPLRASVA